MIVHQCLTCKQKRRMLKVKLRLTKDGRPRLEGRCSECGGKMSRMLPKFAR